MNSNAAILYNSIDMPLMPIRQDILAGVLCGLLIVAGVFCMFLFLAPRWMWL